MKIEKVAIVGRGALGILYGAHFTEKLGKQAVSFVAGEDRIERYMSSQPVCNGRACVFGNSKMQFLAIKSTISQHPSFLLH